MLLLFSSGVIRKNCTYMNTWQSYKCFQLTYRMLVIESLDADTETRRLSPVAVLGDGFVDLINGRSRSKWYLWNKVKKKRRESVFNSAVYLCVQVLRITVGVRATPARRECLSSTASSPPVAPTTSTSAASALRSFASWCWTLIHLRSVHNNTAPLYSEYHFQI